MNKHLLGKLALAVEHGNLSETTKLISDGVDFKDNNNWYMFMACHKGHTDIVSLLLDKGVDINCVNPTNHTPIHQAIIGGHADTVKFLLDKGADIKKTNINGSGVIAELAQNQSKFSEADFKSIQIKLSKRILMNTATEGVDVIKEGLEKVKNKLKSLRSDDNHDISNKPKI